MGQLENKKIIDSPFGKIILFCDEEALTGLYFESDKYLYDKRDGEFSNNKIFEKVEKYLEDYFKGKNPKCDFKIKFQGTEFQEKVWNILLEIPYGKTMSYKEIGDKIGTKAYRAVGSAVGKNKISIIIPCHRVLSKNSLGGYRAGLEIKEKLLKIENN